MEESLRLLAEKLGVATDFSDAGLVQKDYCVDEKIIRKIISSLGFKCDTNDDINSSMARLDNKRYKTVLEPIYVCCQDKVCFDVVVPSGANISKITVKDSSHHPQDIEYSNIASQTSYDGKYNKITYLVHQNIAAGYYELDVKIADKNYKSRLAVAPKKCYDIDNQNNKLWGFALQLYSVKSKRNWGVGDFTDLINLVDMSSNCGADIIGLNPLNVLCHDFPENASPYQSISRLFLNPIYIDIENVPEYEPTDKQLIEGVLAEVKSSEYIQYNKIYPLKVKILEKCFKRFKEQADSSRKEAYNNFCHEYGAELDKLALFQCLYETQCPTVWGGWRAWPEGLRSPQGKDIPDFIEKHQGRIEFFKFMQFEAYRQFDIVKKRIDEKGLKIGMYRDLAVGVGKDSAEYWGDSSLFITECGAGAPPDAFFPCGQQWGLGVFSPLELKERAYEPFIKILRANMKNAGALRMDHVMSLMRLFIIPDNYDGGTYLYFNFDDMLNIVVLESYLNRCIIVGESIGNVPDGFIEAIRKRNIHSLSVLWSERSNAGWGGFYAPQDYPSEAFVSVGTHDMPPLKMWWYGYDIELAYSLGMIDDEEAKTGAYHKREADRGLLLSSLDAAGVWPEDKPRQSNYIYGDGYPEGIEEAVSRYMSKSSSTVFLAQFEDFLHVVKQQNLPGTDRDKHPNWRLKLPVNLEDLSSDCAFVRNVSAIKRER